MRMQYCFDYFRLLYLECAQCAGVSHLENCIWVVYTHAYTRGNDGLGGGGGSILTSLRDNIGFFLCDLNDGMRLRSDDDAVDDVGDVDRQQIFAGSTSK